MKYARFDTLVPRTNRLPHAPSPAAMVCALDALEPRRLFAIDVSPSVAVEAGVFGVGDSVHASISIHNAGSNVAEAGSVITEVILSDDTIIGNDDDRQMTVTANDTTIPAGGTRNVFALFDIPAIVPAGDYFVGVMLYNANETNTANNSTVTATQVVRVVKEQLTSPTIIGGDGNDVIKIEQHLQNTIVTVNNLSKVFENDAFDHLFIDGGLGNDRIFVTNDQVDIRLQVTGGGGADVIIGGNANDELSGGLGRDKLFGGKGDDLMIGGADNDYLGGERGYDTMIGAGGNDRLADVVGRDWFIGGNGNDTIIARDLTPNGSNDPDTVSGNAGTDKAQIDAGFFADINSNIEELIP